MDFYRGVIDWWLGLPTVFRCGVALVFLLISTGLFFLNIFWPWGGVLGAILLVMSFPADAEKKGYHD